MISSAIGVPPLSIELNVGQTKVPLPPVPPKSKLPQDTDTIVAAEALMVIIRAAAVNTKYFMLQSSNFIFRTKMPCQLATQTTSYTTFPLLAPL
jgi:hypothetical protein